MSLGVATNRRDARGKTTGATDYPGDLAPAGALHALVVFTNKPHARLLALDVPAAEVQVGSPPPREGFRIEATRVRFDGLCGSCAAEADAP